MDHYDVLRRMFFGPQIWPDSSRPQKRPEAPGPLDLRKLRAAPQQPAGLELRWDDQPLGA